VCAFIDFGVVSASNVYCRAQIDSQTKSQDQTQLITVAMYRLLPGWVITECQDHNQ